MISFASCTLALLLYAQNPRAAEPDRAQPHIDLAVQYGPAHALDAIAELGAALNLSPGNRQAQNLLRAIARQAALNAMHGGDPQQAFNLLMKAHNILPQDTELLYECGFAALASELYKEARQLLEQTLSMDPSYKDARYALARVYLAENMAPQAEDQMRKYLAVAPQDATAEYGLGYVLLAEQKLDDAKAAFEKSMAMRPDQTESLFELGEIALEQARDSEARDNFDKVIARNPHHGGALTGMGIIAYRAAHYDEACADLERAIAAAPNYQKAHYYYALALSRLGKRPQAEREFEISRSLQKHHEAVQ